MTGELGATETTLTPADILAGEAVIQKAEIIKAGQGELEAGAIVAEGFAGGFYALDAAAAVVDEVVASQTGSAVNFSGYFAQRPIIPGTVEITALVNSAVSTSLTEDGQGHLTGSHGSGTMTYGLDGRAHFDLTWDVAPDNPSDITADYEHGAADLKHEPAGVLLAGVDATSADQAAQVLKLGPVRSAALVWPAGISEANKTWAQARLAKRGVHAV